MLYAVSGAKSLPSGSSKISVSKKMILPPKVQVKSEDLNTSACIESSKPLFCIDPKLPVTKAIPDSSALGIWNNKSSVFLTK